MKATGPAQRQRFSRAGSFTRGAASGWRNSLAVPAPIQLQRRDGRVTGFRLRNKRVHALEFTKLQSSAHPTPSSWSCSN
jgi:hypothetical protein